MLCERCNALDGRNVEALQVDKGGTTVTRNLCLECAENVNQTYPIQGLKAEAPAAEPEADTTSEDQESEAPKSKPSPRRR